MNLTAYQTNIGVFIELPWAMTTNRSIEVNGTPLEEYHRFGPTRNTIKVDSTEGLLITALRATPAKISHYRLIDSTLACERLPLQISVEDAGVKWVEGSDDDASTSYEVWGDKYAAVSSLYEEVRTPPEEYRAPMEYKIDLRGTWNITGSLTDKFDATTIGGPSHIDPKKSKAAVNLSDLAAVASYDDMAKLLQPNFLLPYSKCALSGNQMYSIIRDFVKRNVLGRMVSVRSDYDFCFRVELSYLCDQYMVKKEKLTRSGNSYRPARFENVKRDTRTKTLLEITPPSSCHSGCNVVQPLEADNIQDLYNKLTEFLESLLADLRTPMKECPHCKGLGLVSSN